MKFLLTRILGGLTILFLVSCYYSSPAKRFADYAFSHGKCIVSFWKNSDNYYYVQIEYPTGEVTSIMGLDYSDYLSEEQAARAVYQYVGDWEEEEKPIMENYSIEYGLWLRSQKSP